MDWFLYDNGLRHEKVNYKQKQILKNEKHWAKLFSPILLMKFCMW